MEVTDGVLGKNRMMVLLGKIDFHKTDTDRRACPDADSLEDLPPRRTDASFGEKSWRP